MHRPDVVVGRLAQTQDPDVLREEGPKDAQVDKNIGERVGKESAHSPQVAPPLLARQLGGTLCGRQLRRRLRQWVIALNSLLLALHKHLHLLELRIVLQAARGPDLVLETGPQRPRHEAIYVLLVIVFVLLSRGLHVCEVAQEEELGLGVMLHAKRAALRRPTA